MRLLSRIIALTGVVLLAAASTAGAKPTSAEVDLAIPVFESYGKTGQIDPCEYTPEQLQAALEYGQTPEIQQYASDFPAAVRDAITARARGACDEPTPTPTPDETAAPATTPPPAADAAAAGGADEPVAPSTETVVLEPPGPAVVGATSQPTGADPALERAATAGPGTPMPLIGLGVLSSLALLTLLMLAALRRLGVIDGPLEPAYHSWREAQWRAGGVWGDFRDWLKFGR
ncbi:MAG: hypothetical protein WKF94_10210 [Solirubrobacteraceae bacterium]